MKMLCNVKLSEHKYKTPEGYLVCQDAILARTGKQQYIKSEIFPGENSDEVIDVDRPYNEVFSDATLASFENKPICCEHPDIDVGPENYNELAVGHVNNIRRSKVDGQDVMIGDLLITDAQCIQDIEEGIRTDLSCGYDCDIEKTNNGYEQINIRGNHVALCEQGRAGIARIVDSKWKSPVKDSIAKGTLIQEFGKQGKQYKISKIVENVIYAENLETGKIVLFKKDEENKEWAIIGKSEVKDSIKIYWKPEVGDNVKVKEISLGLFRTKSPEEKATLNAYIGKTGIISEITKYAENDVPFKMLVKFNNGIELEFFKHELEPVDSKVIDSVKYIYLFDKSDITNADKVAMKKYNLEVLGTNEFDKEVNLAVKGDLADIKKFCKEYMNYELHPDYLYKENEFAGEITKDSVKDSKVPGVDDWVIDEAKKIVKAGYDDKEDLLEKIEELSDDLTPRNIVDIYHYLKRTMNAVDSIKDEANYQWVVDINRQDQKEKFDACKKAGLEIEEYKNGFATVKGPASKMAKALDITIKELDDFTKEYFSTFTKLNDKIDTEDVKIQDITAEDLDPKIIQAIKDICGDNTKVDYGTRGSNIIVRYDNKKTPYLSRTYFERVIKALENLGIKIDKSNSRYNSYYMEISHDSILDFGDIRQFKDSENYSKKFYEKMIKQLEKKIKKLDKQVVEDDDENKLEIEKSKIRLKKEMEKQIEDYQKKIDEFDEEE